MGKLEIHGSDKWKAGRCHSIERASMVLKPHGMMALARRIHFKQIVSIQAASDEKRKAIGATAAGGIFGALLLGPLGALVGILGCGNRHSTTFTCRLNDGTEFLGTCSSKDFKRVAGAAMKNRRR